MSAQEIHTLAQQFADAFTNKNLKAALDMLSEDLEIFDHVPYRFDNKAQFATYLAGAVESIASMNFGFRQPSCRVFNDTTGIVNAYDMFTGVTKDSKVQTTHEGTYYPWTNDLGLCQTRRAVEDRERPLLSSAACGMKRVATGVVPGRLSCQSLPLTKFYDPTTLKNESRGCPSQLWR